MFRRTKVCSALIAAFGGGVLAAATPAFAQQAPVTLERVEVTGSAIKRIDAETAVPVTVVKMEDLKKQGVTSIEQVMATLSAVQVQLGTNFTVGCSNCGGAAFADLRGIGQNKTLVLLNGRRIANNAIDGSAPDLNTIPFAAIERIEVLRDGASALYGTDAIGGVINFITRKDFTGGTITIGGDAPQHPGGHSRNANFGFGFGDLDKQNFNIFGFVDYQKQNKVKGSQRDFNSRIAGGLSGSTSPANYFQDGAITANPAAPSCAAGTFLIPTPGDTTSCTMTTSKFVDFIPESERISAMLKGTFKLNDNHQLGLEYFGTKTKVLTQIAPLPFGNLYQNPTRPDGTPNPYYPASNGLLTINPTYAGGPDDPTGAAVGDQPVDGGSALQPGFVHVKWRDLPNGPRADKNVNFQQRFVASLEGNVGGWDYQAAAVYSSSKVDQYLVGGYANGDVITGGVLDGVINPFGDQSAESTALLNTAFLPGLLVSSRGTTKGVDAHASREVGDWFGAGRPAALALGGEFRRENFQSAANTPYAELVVASTGTDPTTFNAGARTVGAAYAELNMPILKALDVTAAVRYDRYSDFGNTTNPKLSFRYQPIQQLLVRGSVGTGFRAPSLYDINSSNSYSNTGQEDNPFTCPGGVPAAGFGGINNCQSQFVQLSGGNKNLKPEKSKSATLGLVFEPMADTSVGLDFWWIRLKQTIGAISETTLFNGDTATFGSYFHTRPNGTLSTDGTQCPGVNCGYVDLRTQNLGGTNTNGVDLSANYKLRAGSIGAFTFGLNSTYVMNYEYQDYEDGPWNKNVGVFSGQGPIFRWQHNLSANWALAAFSVGVAVHYKSGYIDQDPSNRVASYTTADLFGSWEAFKGLTLTAGVRNIADRDPPFTNQELNFQGGGWDSRFTDPLGRTYYLRGTYTF